MHGHDPYPTALVLTEGENPAKIDLASAPYKDEGLTVSILGNKGSGKSNTLSVLSEEAHRIHLRFIFIDPNGDAMSLGELGDDVLTVGDNKHPDEDRRAIYPISRLNNPEALLEMVLDSGFSLVLDMSAILNEELRYIRLAEFLNLLFVMEHKFRIPVMLIVDEVQNFAPQSKGTKEQAETKRALRNIAFDGRKRGIMLVSASLHAVYVDKAVIRGANVRMFGLCTDYPDYQQIKHHVPVTFNQLKELGTGELFVSSKKNFGKIKMRRKKTSDLGHTPSIFTHRKTSRPSWREYQIELPIQVQS